MSDDAVKTCQHNGCTSEYREADNNETSCRHHPGQPVFHEGLKGWSCCKKRVTDFSDFLSLPGCTWSTHSDEKRVVVPLETAPKPSEPLTGPTSSSGGVEKYGHARSAAFKESGSNSVAPIEAVEERDPLEEPDAADAVIKVGADCLHRGCSATYVDESSRSAECLYHPGRPVFHDMSKGWSCCRRKVLEFDDFLKLEGCTSGRHKFVPPPRPAVEVIEFRYDFFQSVPKVTVSVYCKNADKTATRVEFRSDSITWHIVGPDGQIADKTLQLAERIKASECSFAVLSTKVELRLVKEEAVQWTTLERQ
jgi:hypothetical protein